MLIECPPGAIKINDIERIKDFRINVVGGQFRAKFDVVKDDSVTPLDVIAYSINKKLDGIGITVGMEGVEYNRHLPFDIKISYKLTGIPWRLSGKFGKKELKGSSNSLIDIVAQISDAATI